ncbi:MAG: hypothetical protein FE035_00995 [Thermoplasmata archaeon]|nr:MAG: hypothetical protein FE035_00995 [Thermoplasmata archaeon]
MRVRVGSKLVLMFFVFTLVFVAFQLFAPVFLPPSTIGNLSGSVGIIDNSEKVRQIGLPWRIVYLVGDFMCHQRADRSFFINSNQMPFLQQMHSYLGGAYYWFRCNGFS